MRLLYKVSEDETVTISYNPNITTNKDGNHFVCYSKAGKKLYDTGDDRSAGWGYVNASDPVGIVGEYLGR